MNILNEVELQAYLELHSTKLHPYLQKIERETHLSVLQSHMISGLYQGLVLSLICKISGAKQVLEIGSFTGFSALVFAEALPDNGKVFTIEADKEMFEMSKSNIDMSPWKDKVVSICGDAVTVLPKLLATNTFDIVFIDADKKNNLNYFNMVIDFLKPGSIILIDNVLWKGKVLNESKDNTTENIHQLNSILSVDERIEVIVLPIRDGISLIRKK